MENIKISTGTITTHSSFYDDAMLDYLLQDLTIQKSKEAEENLQREINQGKKELINQFIDEIKQVSFDTVNKATIIRWQDGDKTVVLCQPGDEFDKEKGLALAIIKHLFGDIGYYNTIFKKFINEV